MLSKGIFPVPLILRSASVVHLCAYACVSREINQTIMESFFFFFWSVASAICKAKYPLAYQ